MIIPVVVGAGHDDLVLGDGHAARLGELTLQDPELSKLAVVNHFLAANLGLRRVGDGSRGHRTGVASKAPRVGDGVGQTRDEV